MKFTNCILATLSDPFSPQEIMIKTFTFWLRNLALLLSGKEGFISWRFW